MLLNEKIKEKILTNLPVGSSVIDHRVFKDPRSRYQMLEVTYQYNNEIRISSFSAKTTTSGWGYDDVINHKMESYMKDKGRNKSSHVKSVHYDQGPTGLCNTRGLLPIKITTDKKKVTCKNCLIRLEIKTNV